MKSLKDLRVTLRERSLSSSRSSSTPANGAKLSGVIHPPKQVIRATKDYESQSPCELSFHRGDFFHVISYNRPGLRPNWIEACNPVTNARGLVPESYFDVLHRSSPTTAYNLTGHSDLNPTGSRSPIEPTATAQANKRVSASGRSPSSWFATAKFDFWAERSQELDAKEGDGLIVVARSDEEWLVAKPLGRLGVPGLIPLAFVVFRDTASGEPVPAAGVREILNQIPTVRKWEEKNERYRQNSIPLGKFELPHTDHSQLTNTRESPLPPAAANEPGRSGSVQLPQPTPAGAQNAAPWQEWNKTRHASGSSASTDSRSVRSSLEQSHTASMHFLPMGMMTSASVDAFHYEPNDYWYRLRVSYVSTLSSTDVPGELQGHEVRDMILYRLYEDFAEFHSSLMRKSEGALSSRVPARSGSLPTLPPPLAHVDEHAAAQRRNELDAYLRLICHCPEQILRSNPVRAFLELRPGDRCKTTVAPSKRASRADVRTSEQISALEMDLAAVLQGMNAGKNDRQTSANDHSSITSTPVFSRTNSSATLSMEVPTYYRVKAKRRDNPTQILAIRMPPQFKYADLLSKIQERLGSDIRTLHTTEAGDDSVLKDDNDLQAWMQEVHANTKKPLLYTDT